LASAYASKEMAPAMRRRLLKDTEVLHHHCDPPIVPPATCDPRVFETRRQNWGQVLGHPGIPLPHPPYLPPRGTSMTLRWPSASATLSSGLSLAPRELSCPYVHGRPSWPSLTPPRGIKLAAWMTSCVRSCGVARPAMAPPASLLSCSRTNFSSRMRGTPGLCVGWPMAPPDPCPGIRLVTVPTRRSGCRQRVAW
jgi:hypothetical protein